MQDDHLRKPGTFWLNRTTVVDMWVQYRRYSGISVPHMCGNFYLVDDILFEEYDKFADRELAKLYPGQIFLTHCALLEYWLRKMSKSAQTVEKYGAYWVVLNQCEVDELIEWVDDSREKNLRGDMF